NVELVAVPDPGSRFAGWSGLFTGTGRRSLYPAGAGPDAQVTLTFEKTSPYFVGPNSVIINEYWVNDGGTIHEPFGPIEGDWIELLVVADGLDLRGWRITDNEHAT